jgi:hypothetical protein
MPFKAHFEKPGILRLSLPTRQSSRHLKPLIIPLGIIPLACLLRLDSFRRYKEREGGGGKNLGVLRNVVGEGEGA